MSNGIELAPLTVDVRADLDSFNRGMDTVDQRGTTTASNVSGRLNGIGKSLTNIGSKLTKSVSLPLTAVGVIGAKVGMDFEEQMDKVSAISGATGEDFNTLKSKAEEMGAKTKFSATEAGQGLEYMAMAGWKTNDMVNGIEPVLNLAIASNEDLATTSDIVTDALTAFGLKAQDAGMFTDVLAATSSNANTNVSLMGETFKYAAPVAGALGYNVKDTALAIGLMANSGIKASQAGTALRAGLTNLAKPTDKMQAAMDKYGISLTDSHGKMKDFREVIINLRDKMGSLDKQTKAAAVAQIFGKESMSGWLAVINSSKGDFDKLANAIDNSKGATEEMAETMSDNAKGSLLRMKSALENGGIKVFEALAPSITSVAEGIGNLADKFSNLSPQTQKLILKMGMFAIALGPALSLVGKGIGLFTTISGAIGATSAATVGAGAAASGAAVGLGALSSVALPLIGVLGAVAGGVYLYTKNTELMNSSCLKSREELGMVGNVLEVLHGDIALTAEQMDKMNIKHKEWSSKISPETQKALTDTSNKIANLNFELEHSNGLDGALTKNQIEAFKKRTDSLFNETIEKIKQRSPEVQKEMAKAFKADDGTLDKNEKELMNFFNKSQDNQIKKVKEYQEKINQIYDKAANQNRDLKEEEIKTIQQLTEKMGQVSLNNTVKNNQELIAAKADFNARMKNLDMNGLSKLLSEKAKARDKELKLIKLNYDKRIEELKLYRPKMNREEQKACDEQIKKLEKLKTDSVNNEKQKYIGFLNTAKKKYPELIDYIDTSNGKIMSNEEQNNYKRLTRYSQNMEGMMGITKTGYYKIKDTVSGEMHNCFVEVDKTTGRITGAWDQSTGEIYGNPIKAREDIDADLKNGVKFQPIVDSYDSKKDAINKNAITVQCEKDTGLFDWISPLWEGVLSSLGPVGSLVGSVFNSSNYNGLDYVPFDGYIARLHKGERILTAEENEAYEKDNGDIKVTNNFYGKVESPYEVAKATKRSMRELQFS